MRSDPGRRSWPAGTIAFHITADIAAAVLRYVRATGDAAFEREGALELLVETARLFTNLMAQQNLTAAADAARRHPAEARAPGAEDARWRAGREPPRR